MKKSISEEEKKHKKLMLKNMNKNTKKYLADNKLSKDEFCHKISLSTSTLDKYLYEQVNDITVYNSYKIAKELNISLEKLFGISDEIQEDNEQSVSLWLYNLGLCLLMLNIPIKIIDKNAIIDVRNEHIKQFLSTINSITTNEPIKQISEIPCYKDLLNYNGLIMSKAEKKDFDEKKYLASFYDDDKENDYLIDGEISFVQNKIRKIAFDATYNIENDKDIVRDKLIEKLWTEYDRLEKKHDCNRCVELISYDAQDLLEKVLEGIKQK